jgi:hypothetical protein
MSCVYRNTIDPLCVSQGAPPQQKLFKIERNRIPVLKLDITLECVDRLILLIALDSCLSIVFKHSLVIFGQGNAFLSCLLVFQICLSVQIFGLNVANSLW